MGNLRACFCATLVAAAVSAAPACATDVAPDIFGTWWATEYHARIQVLGGGDVPLNAAGKAAYDRNVAGLKDGSIKDDARRICVPDGLPRLLATPYPFAILSAPGEVVMVHELSHQIRVIALDKPLPSDQELIPYPYYNGHSVGHYDGDTLVIETAGLQ